MSSEYALRAIDLSKSFGQTQALINLNLDVGYGEIICLLGANGAGKTTTINLFLGFLKADSGQALVGDVDADKYPVEARKKLAYLPESVALYPKLSGMENLEFFDGLAGGGHKRDELAAMLERAGLPRNLQDHPTAGYSKGMRQKVGIAIAMARDVKTLLLDEPLSGLDPFAANSLGLQICRLRDQGCAVLMATHDIFRAKEIGNRIGIMMHGRLVNLLDAAALDAKEIEAIYLAHLHEGSKQTEVEAA